MDTAAAAAAAAAISGFAGGQGCAWQRDSTYVVHRQRTYVDSAGLSTGVHDVFERAAEAAGRLQAASFMSDEVFMCNLLFVFHVGGKCYTLQ